MHPIVRFVTTGLESTAQEYLSDALAVAGGWLERWRAETDGRRPEPFADLWPAIVYRGEIDETSARAVIAALMAFAEGNPNSPSLHGIFWALSKAQEPALRPWLENQLRMHVDGDAGVLYNCMIALEFAGAQVFRGASSWDREVEKNRVAARSYLDTMKPSTG